MTSIKPKSGKVISIFTSKGGAGKTTLCASLAAEWSERGRDIALIDCDAGTSLAQWHASSERLREIPLQVTATAAAGRLAREAARGGALVLVDLPGAASVTTISALENSDLLIIPCRPSALDALRAVATLRTCDEVGRARRRPLPALVVLNGVTKRSTISSHIRKELEAAGATVAQSMVSARTAFQVAATAASAPAWMGASGRDASTEIAMLADEIEFILRKIR